MKGTTETMTNGTSNLPLEAWRNDASGRALFLENIGVLTEERMMLLASPGVSHCFFCDVFGSSARIHVCVSTRLQTRLCLTFDQPTRPAAQSGTVLCLAFLSKTFGTRRSMGDEALGGVTFGRHWMVKYFIMEGLSSAGAVVP